MKLEEWQIPHMISVTGLTFNALLRNKIQM